MLSLIPMRHAAGLLSASALLLVLLVGCQPSTPSPADAGTAVDREAPTPHSGATTLPTGTSSQPQPHPAETVPAQGEAPRPGGQQVPVAGTLPLPEVQAYLHLAGPETLRTWERFRHQHPGVDPTDRDALEATQLHERSRYPFVLDHAERLAYAAWLTDVEAMAHAMVDARAAHLGIPVTGTTVDGREFVLEGFRGAEPIYLYTESADAAVSTAAHWVRRSPAFDPVHGPELDGAGFSVLVQDAGRIRSNPEFRNDDDTAWRIINARTSAIAEHATHVGGIIGARGLDPLAQGMAPAVHLISTQRWSSADILNYGMASPGTPNRAILGNTSLGDVNHTWSGVYSTNAAAADQLFFDTPFYLHSYSAGNSGYDADTDEVRFISITRSRKEGKNLFAVGNVLDVPRDADGVRTGEVEPRPSSSRGPVRDGRIKPDIVANGSEVYAPFSPTEYDIRSGTSMASPNMVGSAVLLQDYFSRRFPGRLMRTATLMTVIINAAEDVGIPGPDYTFGWGLMNTLEAGRTIRRYADNPHGRELVEDLLLEGQTLALPYAHAGGSPIRVTLAWVDPPGPVRDLETATLPALVNDLNLRIIGPDQSVHLPFVMPYVTGTDDHPPFSFELIETPATTGINTTDNKIQIVIADPQAGSYTVEVSHAGALLGGSQHFSMAVSGLTSTLPAAPPIITSHTTTSPGNREIVFFELEGSGFLLGAELWFERPGFDPVAAPVIQVASSGLRAEANVAAMEPGPWQVVVRNADGQQVQSAATFEAWFEGEVPFAWTGGPAGTGNELFAAATGDNWAPAVFPDDFALDMAKTFRITGRNQGSPADPIGAGGLLSLEATAYLKDLVFDDAHGHFPEELVIVANQEGVTTRRLHFTTPDSTFLHLADSVRGRIVIGLDRTQGDLSIRLPDSGVSTIHVGHLDAVLDLRGLVDAATNYGGIHAGSTTLANDRAILRKTGAGTLDLRVADTQGNRVKGLIIEGGMVIVSKNPDIAWNPDALAEDHIVIDGGALHFDGFTANSGANRGIQVGNGGGTLQITGQNHAILGVVADRPGTEGTVFKTGEAALRFAAANTYSGGTHVFEGRLRYTLPESLGSGPVSLEDGTSIAAWAAGIVLTNDIVVAGDNAQFGGDGQPTLLAGTVSINEDSSTIHLANDATFSGPLVGGTLRSVTTTANTTQLVLEGTGSYPGTTVMERGRLVVNGSLSAGVTAARALVEATEWIATLAGTGAVGGNVLVHGELRPGAAVSGAVGSLSIGGGLTVAVDGLAGFELAGADSHDQVQVAGPVVIEGRVQVTLLGGYVPTAGSAFRLVVCDAPLSLGEGLAFVLPSLPDDREWDTSAFAATGTISVAAPDGFGTWIAAFGLTGDAALPGADPDGDGLPNSIEFLLGFDPTDASSTLRAALLEADGELRLVINRVVPVGSFAVESTGQLGGTWTVLTDVPIESAGEHHVVILPAAGTQPLFYRVRYTAP